MRIIAIIICSLWLVLSLTSCKISDSAQKQQGEFSLEVKGEVQNQGVYRFKDGDTIVVAVTRAGGLYQWPPNSGMFEPNLATITFANGVKKDVARKAWSRYRLKPGDKVYINRNWL